MSEFELDVAIGKAEERRELNLSSEPKLLTISEKQNLIERYHPDFRNENFSEIATGKNKGQRAPKRLVKLLNSKSLAYENKLIFRSPTFETDVLIIGGGGAGCAAALEAIKYGSVILATKFRLGDGNTLMAEGGLQAATESSDSEEKHFYDTYKGGLGKGDVSLVKKLVFGGKETIDYLIKKGVSFDRGPGGAILSRHGGGTTEKRIHCAKDCTGLEIMRVLKKEVFSSDVKVLEYLSAVEILTDNCGRAVGAVFIKTGGEDITVIRAKNVIVASGGAGRLYYGGFSTSNSYGSTGDGLVLLYRAGCSLVEADSLQYHPTGSAYPEFLKGALITEKARSLGAKLLNKNGETFVNSLETRDAVCAAIIKECEEGRGIVTSGSNGVLLDIPMIDLIHGKGKIESELPNLFREYINVGIDIRKYPVPVYPTLHYQNGGVKIDENGRTEVENLYAVGEVSGGVHGRNRIMGNSLLEIIVFGRAAGEAAGKAAKKTEFSSPSEKTLKNYYKDVKKEDGYSPIILPIPVKNNANPIIRG